jgi:hypothetical protein
LEPWACVEDSYVNLERQTIKPAGRLLIVAEGALPDPHCLGLPFAPEGRPAEILVRPAAQAAAQPNEGFDDIIYFGAERRTIEVLNDKLAPRGIMNIVLGGKKIGTDVSVGRGLLQEHPGHRGNSPGRHGRRHRRGRPHGTDARHSQYLLRHGEHHGHRYRRG